MRVFCAGFNLYGQFINTRNVGIETFEHTDYGNADDILINHTYSVIKSGNDYQLNGLIDGETHRTKSIKLHDKIVQISCKVNNALFLTDCGDIWRLSENDTCDYDLKNITNFTKVEVSDKDDKIVKISCGLVINCAYSLNGYVYNIPNRLNKLLGVVDIQCGREHCLVLTGDGAVYSFGCGSRGQLGHGDLDDCHDPKLIEALSGIRITKLSCGYWHSAVLSSEGDVYMWGWNSNGQLGLATNKTRDDSVAVMTSPCVLDIERNVQLVECGARHTIVLLDDNKLYGFGWNKYNQLGIVSKTENIYEMIFLYDFTGMVVRSLRCGPWSSAVIVDNN